MADGLQVQVALDSEVLKNGEPLLEMMPMQPAEENFEEMTVEIDVNTIKGSPLDQESGAGTATDDDSQQNSSSNVIIKEDEDVTFSVMTPCEVDTSFGDSSNVKDSNTVTVPTRKTKPGKTYFYCDVCKKIFEKRSRLLSHMLTHSNEKDHICPVCNKGFKNKSQLQRHSNTHSEVPRYRCNICGRGFKHNDVAKHIRRFHNGPRKSARGGVANPHATNLHYSSYQSPVQETHQQLQSSIENQLTRLPQQDGEHLPQEQLEPNQSKDNNTDQQYQQSIQQELIIPDDCHEEGQSSESPSNIVFSCNKCDKSFLKRSGLASHMILHQRSDEAPVTAKSKHQCHICQKTFTRASGLNGHILLHSRTEKRREPNPDFRCHICGKLFTRRTGLNAHVLQHGGVPRFWCDEPDCGKGFVHSYQMTRHKRSHSDVFPYTCTVCGKSFRHNDLSKHMRIHTGVKPYNCQHCGKAFAFSSSLRTHERMHLAVREHICEICNAGFTSPAGLRRHFKSHQDDKDELCVTCGKRFPSKMQFNLHIQEHAQQDEVQQVHIHEVHVPQEIQLQIQEDLQQPQDGQVQLQVQQLSEVELQQIAQVHEVQHVEVHSQGAQHPAHHPVAIHVNNSVIESSSGTTLATLTAPNPAHIQVALPVVNHSSVETEQATVSSPASVGALPVLVPFSVSVPISVPFNVNMNMFSGSSEQLHINHFLNWEQKF